MELPRLCLQYEASPFGFQDLRTGYLGRWTQISPGPSSASVQDLLPSLSWLQPVQMLE